MVIHPPLWFNVGTNLSSSKAFLSRWFSCFPRWDILVPWYLRWFKIPNFGRERFGAANTPLGLAMCFSFACKKYGINVVFLWGCGSGNKWVGGIWPPQTNQGDELKHMTWRWMFGHPVSTFGWTFPGCKLGEWIGPSWNSLCLLKA